MWVPVSVISSEAAARVTAGAAVGIAACPGRTPGALRLANLAEAYTTFSRWLTNLFPVWTVLVSIVALRKPSAFTWLTTEYFTAGLATLMLSMGITLAPADFVRVATCCEASESARALR